MNYEEMIKVIANKKSTVDEGDVLIRDMSRVIDDIMSYRYVADHHEGKTDKVLADKASVIRNSVAVLVSDLDIYQEMLGITDSVSKKKAARVERLVDKM